ncbi:MAG: cadherin repeat domain-containing protein, partial [Bacteroidetes bacterium]
MKPPGFDNEARSNKDFKIRNMKKSFTNRKDAFGREWVFMLFALFFVVTTVQAVEPGEKPAFFDNPLSFWVDSDGDGLDDATENTIGTNPAIADTDGDGMNDGDEVNAGSNPLDACDPNPAAGSCCTYSGRTFTFAATGQNDGSGGVSYTTVYALTDQLGNILQVSNSNGFTATNLGLHYVYGINYRTDKPLSNFSVGNNIGAVSGDCLDISAPFIFSLCNQLPEISNNGGTATASVNFNENGTAVDNYDATDADGDTEGGNGLTWTLSGPDKDLFQVDANGNLAFINAPDYENPTDVGADNSYEVTITVTDSDGGTDEQALTIAVQDVDEFDISAVTDADGATNEVNESAPANTTVGVTALATDADATDNVTYALSDDYNGAFQIDPTTGVITVLDATPLDLETDAMPTVTVLATSDDGSTASETFTINLLDDNTESPVGPISDTNNASDGISESTINGALVGITASASDPDLTDVVTYSLSNDAGGRFEIDPNTGIVTVKDASLLNAENNASHDIEVTATSTDGTTSTATFTIQIIDFDEFDISPVTDSDNTANEVLETAPAGTTVGLTALATDADLTDDVTYTLLNDANGAFQIDPTTGVVSVLDPMKINYEVNTSLSVEVKATSDDGSTATETFVIQILDDKTEADITQVQDNDPTANEVVETAAAGDPVGITAFADDADGTDSVTYTLTDDAGGRFQIDPNTGLVTVADPTLLDAETAASHSITVLATSTDGTTSTMTLTIQVIDDTTEFPISAITDKDFDNNLLNENAPAGTAAQITAFASDDDISDNVTYELIDDFSGTFTIDAQTGIVTVLDNTLLDFEANPTADITIKATSTDGTTSTATLTVTLVDDNTEFTITPISDSNPANNEVMENSPAGTVVGITAFASDADGTDDVTYTLTDDFGGMFAIDPTTGVIVVANPAGMNYESLTSAMVTVLATSDDGSTATKDFTIQILDDTSEFIIGAVSDKDFSANEVSESAPTGTTVGLTALAIDPDGTDETTYTLTDDYNGAFAIDPMTGVVTVLDNTPLDLETDPLPTVTVLATSDDGSTSTETFTINLLDDKSEFSMGPVTDNDPTNNEVNESAPTGTPVGLTALATDDDATDNTTYTLTDDYNGAFAIDPTTGEVTVLDPTVLDIETDPMPTV